MRRAADAPAASAASTDFGNVSVRVPGIHPAVAVAPADVALHTREFAAFAGSPEAAAAVTDAAYGLAATVADLLADAGLRAAVRRDFEAAGGVVDVVATFAGAPGVTPDDDPSTSAVTTSDPGLRPA